MNVDLSLESILYGLKWFLIVSNALIFIYLLSTKGNKTTPSSAKKTDGDDDTESKKVLLVIAHPDDECMFFAPTITSLIENEGNSMYVLCLSNGNHEKLGTVREQELLDSCAVLGIPGENVVCIDDPQLQDGPKEKWSKQDIEKHVMEFHEREQFDVIITFDQHGVSGHPNHIACHDGIKEMVLEGAFEESGTRVYKLISTNVIRKYIGMVDLLFCALHDRLFIAPDFFKAYWAMMEHKSQLLWFRRLYVLFSRYMVINTLEPITEIKPGKKKGKEMDEGESDKKKDN